MPTGKYEITQTVDERVGPQRANCRSLLGMANTRVPLDLGRRMAPACSGIAVVVNSGSDAFRAGASA